MANKKLKEKKERKESMDKIDYPKLFIGDAVKLTEKVVNNYGGIISYTELSKIAGAGGTTQGGTFGNITKSLKLYRLMERYGLKEMKVTEEGKMIIKENSEDRKKTSLFSIYKKIPIIAELYNRYGDNIPKNLKGITEFLGTKNLEKREAGRLANLYVKNQSFFENVNEEQILEEKLQKVNIIDKNETEVLCKISYLLGQISPKEEKTKEHLFDSLNKLASKKEFKSLEAFSEAIKYVPEEKKKDIFEKLKKAFEDDSGINLDRTNKSNGE